MSKEIKYITIGRPASDDAVRNLPKSKQTPERGMNIVGPHKEICEMVNPVSLNKALCPEDAGEDSTVPEITLPDVEKFIKGSDFVLIVTSIGFAQEYKIAIEVVKLVKEKMIPFHILLARQFDFASIEDVVKENDAKIEAITDQITKTNIYHDAFDNFPPDMPTKEAFRQISEELYSIMQDIIKKHAV